MVEDSGFGFVFSLYTSLRSKTEAKNGIGSSFLLVSENPFLRVFFLSYQVNGYLTH